MEQLSIQQIVAVAIQRGANSPNPGGPALVWSTYESAYLAWNGSSWESPIDNQKLRDIADLNSFGYLVRQSGTGSIVTRRLAGTSDQIEVLDGDGNQNSAIKLTDTGVIPGQYPKYEVDAQGRIRKGLPLAKSDLPTDFLYLFNEFQDGTLAKPSATGNGSIAIGIGAQSLAERSIALGEQAVTRHYGAFVRSSGRFQTSGDAQTGSYLLKAITTTNFMREMYLDGPSGTTSLIIPDDSTWTFTTTITAHQTNDNNDHAGFVIKGVITKSTGATSVKFQGTPTTEILGRSDTSWVINTSANIVNGSLAFSVRGAIGKTIRWLAHVQTVEITN